ncbi:MAG: hypothetical protein AB3N20_11680 [Rhizobiaceae bacterium]
MRIPGIAVALVAASSFSAEALSRYDSRQLSCDRIQSILQTEGNAILRYTSSRNANIVKYDIFAAPRGQCNSGGRGRLSTVPAADTNSCSVLKCINIKGGGR